MPAAASAMLQLLHNESIAAIIGGAVTAVATYLVVAFTDSRRARRKARKRLPAQLRQYRILLRNRIDGAERARTSLSQLTHLRDTGDRFPVERIRGLAEELAEHLQPNQSMALYNVAFRLEQADALNEKARLQLDQLGNASLDLTRGEMSQRLYNPMLQAALNATYGEEIYLLHAADELINDYLQNRLNPQGGKLVRGAESAKDTPL